jgi:hypothetical protein
LLLSFLLLENQKTSVKTKNQPPRTYIPAHIENRTKPGLKNSLPIADLSVQ